MTTKIFKTFLQERNEKIYRLRKEGVNHKDIAVMFRISVRQVIRAIKTVEKQHVT